MTVAIDPFNCPIYKTAIVSRIVNRIVNRLLRVINPNHKPLMVDIEYMVKKYY
jgi:hypothetical protein